MYYKGGIGIELQNVLMNVQHCGAISISVQLLQPTAKSY